MSQLNTASVTAKASEIPAPSSTPSADIHNNDTVHNTDATAGNVLRHTLGNERVDYIAEQGAKLSDLVSSQFSTTRDALAARLPESLAKHIRTSAAQDRIDQEQWDRNDVLTGKGVNPSETRARVSAQVDELLHRAIQAQLMQRQGPESAPSDAQDRVVNGRINGAFEAPQDGAKEPTREQIIADDRARYKKLVEAPERSWERVTDEHIRAAFEIPQLKESGATPLSQSATPASQGRVTEDRLFKAFEIPPVEPE